MARLIEDFVTALAARHATITTAESCTGGLIAATITDVPGSSAVFRQGVVSYSNEAKIALLDVPPALLKAHGAVSHEVASAMATGARTRAIADVAIAVTGVAGPTGGSPEKPVGLVFIAIATATHTRVERYIFGGDRAAIRAQAVEVALQLAMEMLA